MLRVFAQKQIKEDKLEEALEIIRQLVKYTAQEKDYIYYEAFQDNENPLLITFVETWPSKEALNKHMESDHFKHLSPKLNETCKDGPFYIFENPIK